MSVVEIQIAVAKPPQKEDIRLALSMLLQPTSQPAPPPAPPSSPSADRTRRAKALRCRRCSIFPAESRRLHPDDQLVRPAAGGARPGAASNDDLLDAMTIEPVLRGRGRDLDQSSAADWTGNDWEDLMELPVTSSRRRQVVVDRSARSHRPPIRPLAAPVKPESSCAAGTTGNRPSTIETPCFVQRLKIDTPRTDSKVADRCSKQSVLQGRGLHRDKQQPMSLPRSMALRRNRSEKSVVVRGLPSKTVQTRCDVRPHHQPEPTSKSWQLPEVIIRTKLSSTARKSTRDVVLVSSGIGYGRAL